MKNRIGRNNKLANFSFAILIVGFPLIVLVSMYVDKPYFGSFILSISSFSILGYLTFYGKRYLSLIKNGKTYHGFNFTCFVALIVLIFLILLFNIASVDEPMILQGVASVVVMIYFYLTMMDINLGSISVRLTVVISMLLMISIAILGIADTGFWFSNWRFPYNYLSILLVLVLFLSFENPSRLKTAYYPFIAASISCLIVLGGRSELVVLLLAIFLAKLQNIKFIIGFFVAIGVWWFFLFESTLGFVTDYSEQLRTLGSLMEGLENDESLNDRRAIFSERLFSINESPILGSYGDYDLGRYAHNMFSVWDDYGLVGLFLFLSVLCSYGLRVVSTKSVVMATALIFCVVQWVLFKAHFYPLCWALVGLSFNQYIARDFKGNA